MNGKNECVKYKTTYLSPLGKILLTSDGEFLTGLYFANSADNKKHILEYKTANLEIFDQTKKWLDVYFSGKNPDFTPKYKLDGLSEFRKMVTGILVKIPYGQTITYGDIAKQIAEARGIKRMSAQAVGGAVGANPICIIVPCHRVIGANGNLVGYGGGMENKIALLKLENVKIK